MHLENRPMIGFFDSPEVGKLSNHDWRYIEYHYRDLEALILTKILTLHPEMKVHPSYESYRGRNLRQEEQNIWDHLHQPATPQDNHHLKPQVRTWLLEDSVWVIENVQNGNGLLESYIYTRSIISKALTHWHEKIPKKPIPQT